jgi:alanyl-tRNA synthetase
VGKTALKLMKQSYQEQLKLRQLLQTETPLIEAIQALIEKNKSLEKEIKRAQFEKLNPQSLITQKKVVKTSKGDVEALILTLPGVGREELSKLNDSLREKMPLGVFIFASEGGECLLVSTPKSNKELNANTILKGLIARLGGKGGGRPDFAQGSVSNTQGLLELSQEELAKL